MEHFELTMCIKQGLSSLSTTNAYHVETTVEGVHKVEDNTDATKMTGGVAVWNKKIVKTFPTIEAPIPIIISMSMYKKKTFQTGHKLVGTAHFALADLLKILDKPSVCGKISLNVKRHHLATSHLVIELRLRSINPSIPAIPEVSSTTTQGLHLSPTKAILSVIPSSSSSPCSFGAGADIEEARPVGSRSGSPTGTSKLQLFFTSTRGLAAGKAIGSSMFSARLFLFVLLMLSVTTCTAYQFLVE
jgi:hypothetical protein